MATIIQQPPALCFSSAVDDIIFGCNGDSGLLVLDFICNGERHNALTETLHQAPDGTVRVSDLSSLAEVYARQHLQTTMECSFTDGAGTLAISPVTVLYAMVDVDTTAEDFTQNHFLSILNGEKLTTYGLEERLYAYGAGTVTILADVKLLSGELNTLSAEITASGTTGNISQFDVSPDRVATLIDLAGGILLSYTIEVGGRRQEFLIENDMVNPAPSLIFTNSFGCQEFIHCVGTHKKDSVYDRQSARMFGRLHNYRIIEDRRFTANTGWLNTAMADWADELFRSDEVYLWVDGKVGREVVISDSKSEILNEDNHMPAFEFTYSYSQRIHNVMQPQHAGRIFDNTFDHSFN